jgi:hypothetical protein
LIAPRFAPPYLGDAIPIGLKLLVPVVLGGLVAFTACRSAFAQPAHATLGSPISAAWDDPYALSPSQRFGAAPVGLIDQPLFDGRMIANSPLSPMRMFGHVEPYRGRMFLRGEYLGWFMDPMDTPPLVTTNPVGTPQNQAGFIGGTDTTTLFGGELNDSFRSGFRVRGGWYVDPSRFWAIGGDYYQLFGSGESFNAVSNGSPILARPFFDIVAGRETAQFASFPAVVRGDIAVESDTQLRSFGINLQADAVNPPNHPSQIANGCAREPRVDWIVGYRNVRLEDSLTFRENLTALVPPGGIVNLRESFETENQFQGIELGFVREVPLGRWWFETTSRVAVGNNSQRVKIAGSTRLVEAGVAETFPGGLYAQRTNIGTFERDRFTVVPELGATLGFHLGPRMSLTAGYTFVYISNVVRAGDQIDTDINPGLLPVEVNPLNGPLRPRFLFRETDFYAHGITVGGDFRF